MTFQLDAKEISKRTFKVTIVAKSSLPTKYGDFQIIVFHNTEDDREHLAICKGNLYNQENVLTRVHSECLTGDVFGSKRCDCGEQLEYALQTIQKEGRGVILYMRQEGRGIGLTNKIRAYTLQEEGYDTIEANEKLGFPSDLRKYHLSAEMLEVLGVKSIRLLTNNPQKINELEKYGISISKRVPIIMKANAFNRSYLRIKARKMGHLF